MPKRITKREHDDAVYGCWNKYLSHYGIREAMKIVYGAYKELRRQDRELKEKYGKRKRT